MRVTAVRAARPDARLAGELLLREHRIDPGERLESSTPGQGDDYAG